MAEKKNIFADAAKKRVKEQTGIMESVMRTEAKEKDARATMSISMSAKEKTMLKQYAAAQGKTTAAIIQGWINQYCTNQ